MVTSKHRLFYVNGKLEFAIFYDPSVIDKDIIRANFTSSKDWKAFLRQNEVKSVKNFDFSDDLTTVQIKVKF